MAAFFPARHVVDAESQLDDGVASYAYARSLDTLVNDRASAAAASLSASASASANGAGVTKFAAAEAAARFAAQILDSRRRHVSLAAGEEAPRTRDSKVLGLVMQVCCL